MAQRKITSAARKTSCILAPAILALTIGGLFTAAEAAAATEKDRIINPACVVSDSNPNPACGAIVYANGGAYIVNPVRIKAKTDQPSGPTINGACLGVDYKYTKDILVGQYVTFVVPADCAFRLAIVIVAGTKKDKNLFLVPGCQIVAETVGTTLNNKWKNLQVDWTKKAKENAKEKGVTLPEPPQDNAGYKCGSLGKI